VFEVALTAVAAVALAIAIAESVSASLIRLRADECRVAARRAPCPAGGAHGSSDEVHCGEESSDCG
jgi:hypothetical protein